MRVYSNSASSYLLNQTSGIFQNTELFIGAMEQLDSKTGRK